MIGIKGIGIHVAGQYRPRKELPGYAELPDQEREYFDSCGINGIHHSGEVSAFDLALGASEEVLAKAGVEGSQLDAIIYIRSRIPAFFIASSATRMQAALGAEKAMTWSLSDLGCADSTMALKVARDFLVANRRARNVLVCYGHKQYSPIRFRYPVTIQGDGGMAFLVGKTDSQKLLDLGIEVNGAYWDLFKMEYQDRPYSEYREVCSDLRKYGFELAVESRNRFKEVIDKVLDKQGLSLEGMDHILLQNISRRAFDYYEQSYDIKLSPVCGMNLQQYGHLGCADVFLNYKSGIEEGIFQPGQKVLIMNNSPVAAWSVAVMEV